MERNDRAWMPDRTAEIADDYAAWREMQEDDDQIDPRDLESDVIAYHAELEDEAKHPERYDGSYDDQSFDPMD